MKVITLHQPYASFILHGRKTIETRDWHPHHLGLLAIHAGKTIDKVMCSEFHLNPDTLPVGKILCVVDLVKVVKIQAFAHSDLSLDNIRMGDFTPGRFAWLLENMRPLHEPMEIRGERKLWIIGDPKIEGRY